MMRLWPRIGLVIAVFLMTQRSVIGADDTGAAFKYKELNEAALQCVTAFQSDIAQLGKDHPIFKDFAANKLCVLHVPKPDSVHVSCHLSFKYRTRFIELERAFSANGYDAAEDDGVILIFAITEWPKNISLRGATGGHLIRFGRRHLDAFYFLDVGKNMKDLEAPVKAIAEKRLQEFCAVAEKLR